jgi:hypothetical protein
VATSVTGRLLHGLPFRVRQPECVRPPRTLRLGATIVSKGIWRAGLRVPGPRAADTGQTEEPGCKAR